jgi:CubicO group peptidase (beta-lactamase class C family)
MRPAAFRVLPLVVSLVLAVPAGAFAADPPLPMAAPESQGFDAERLARLDARMKQMVDEGRHAGLVLLVARGGRVVDLQAWGLRDREQKLPMELDTIVRIYSMSKIVTSVAVMQLVEQGRLKLDDPVEKFLPQLAKPKVWAGGTSKKPVLVAAKRSVTIKHLLTHTSGYRYANMYTKGELDDLYAAIELLEAKTLDEAVAKFAKMPLAFQPGDRFNYGLGLDILGAVVQKVAGQPFAEYVAEHVTGPLGMKDTGYAVPAEKRGRLAKIYTTNKDGALEAADSTAMTHADGNGPAWGGAGMFSTIGDYARFGQMLLNGGELDGVRVLGRKTVELMQANHLNHMARSTTQWSEADGFGLGGAVRTDLAKGNALGSVGQFGWTGAATTYFNMDPKERTLLLVFTQHFPHNQHEVFQQASTLFYAAIE